MALKFPRQLNIRTRMLLLCLGIAAPLLAIGNLAVWHEYHTLKAEASRATAFQAAVAVRTVRQWIQSQINTLNTLAAISDIQKLDAKYANAILNAALKDKPYWYDISVLDPKLRVIATAGKGSSDKHFDLRPLMQDGFVQRTISSGKGLISAYNRSPLSGKHALLAATPIYRDGHIQGILVASIKPRSVLKLFTGIGSDDGSMVAVVDEHNRVIARTLQSEYWEGKDFSDARTIKAAKLRPNGQMEVVGIADPIARAYAFERLPENNWHVEVGVPLQTIYGAAHHWLMMMVVLTSVALCVSLMLALFATSHFTQNIRLLVQEVLALGDGNFGQRVKIESGDELGDLAQAFNQMAEQLEINHDLKQMVDSISESIRHSLDLNEILNISVRELGQALSVSRCCLAIVDDHNQAGYGDNDLVFDHVWWDARRAGGALHNRAIRVTRNGALNTVLQERSVLSLDEVGEDWHRLFGQESKSYDDWRSVKSLIACPINTADGAIGMIMVHQCNESRNWTDGDLELVNGITPHIALAVQHARLYNRTKTMAEQEMLINHIVSAVRRSLDLNTILTTVSVELGKAIEADRCQIALPRTDGPLVVTHEYHQDHLPAAKGMSLYCDNMDFHPDETGTIGNGKPYTTLLGIDVRKLISESDNSFSTPDPSRTLSDTGLAVINNVAADSRTVPFIDFLESVESRSLIAAPLLDDRRLVGLLMVHQCSRLRTWRMSEMRLIAAIADQLAIAVSHAQLFAQVRYQAITDGLTGLYNHIYFKNHLSEELRTSQRKGGPCSLLMIDLDKLKQINDNFGHPVGDAAIRHVARILKNLLRSGDTAARYGGEEFGVILPDTSLEEAARIAERLCAQIRSSPVSGLGKITVSVGGAAYPQHAATAVELIEKADKALYAAKHSGRDRVKLHEEEQSTILRLRMLRARPIAKAKSHN